MAGHGPPAKDPSTRARGNKTSTRATLMVVDNPEIPPMPDPADYVSSGFLPGTDGYEEPAWFPAVIAWWDAIWSSPMSSEFSEESDKHGLYLGCALLQESINPRNKITEKMAALTKFEAVVRNYGLNPMARRALQWEIDRGDSADKRTRARKMTEKTASGMKAVDDPRKSVG